MTSIRVRPFHRRDREQLTALVNAHIQAVVPGVIASVNTVLSQLEREPGEFIVDPWVIERTTLVAEQRGRIVAAAHLLHYGTGAEVGESYRDAGEIKWLLCWPDQPYWPDTAAAGNAIAAAAVAYLNRSAADRVYADGALPAPGVYGLPEQWPHIHAILERVGFVPGDRTEIVFLADVDVLDRPSVPISGLTVRRTLGINGTRFAARLDGETLGYIEVANCIGDAGRAVRQDGWADVGNLSIDKPHRRRGIAGWLLGQAAQWLALGHVDQLLAYARHDEHELIAFLEHVGFRELTRTTRGWERDNRS